MATSIQKSTVDRMADDRERFSRMATIGVTNYIAEMNQWISMRKRAAIRLLCAIPDSDDYRAAKEVVDKCNSEISKILIL